MLNKKYTRMRQSTQNMEMFQDISLMGNIYFKEKGYKIPATGSTIQEE